MMFQGPRGTNAVSNPAHIVEFKAGRSELLPGSAPTMRKVVAKKEKGLVFLKNGSDNLLHFCWKNRETNVMEDDLIVFPGDCEFVKVPGCPDGRVMMLKFKNTSDRRCYWLQEPNEDGDADILSKVNDILNNKRPSGNSGERAAGGAAGGGLSASLSAIGLDQFDGDMSSVANAAASAAAMGHLTQQQLLQLLQIFHDRGQQQSGSGGGGSSSSASRPQQPAQLATPAVGSATPNPTLNAPQRPSKRPAGRVEVSQLSDILSQLNSSVAPTPSTASSSSGSRRVEVPLSEVIQAEGVLEVARRHADRLEPHLPAANETGIQSRTQELDASTRSPQVAQCSDIVGHALQSGQLASVLPQFNITGSAQTAAANGDLKEFAKQLTAGNKKEEEEDKGDEKMGEEGQQNEATPIREPDPKRHSKPDGDDDKDQEMEERQ